MATRSTPTRREATRYWLASQSPLQHPPFRWWHALLLLLTALLGVLGIKAPGLMADLSSIELGNSHSTTFAISTVWILAAYALIGVRSYHPLIGVALLCEVVFLPLRSGLFQITQEPLSLALAGLLIPLAILSIRVTVRLNDTDKIRALEAELRGQR